MFTSVFTHGELARGGFPGQHDAIILAQGIPLLQAVPRIEEIVAIYVQRNLMPSKDLGDAYHLAMASYYQIDYLLTWNCRHLANVNKQEHIENVNKAIGLKVPILLTPQMLFSERVEDADVP